MTSPSTIRRLRLVALFVLLVTIGIVLLLPGSDGCQLPEPDAYDPLPRSPTAFSAPRLIVFAIGLAIAISLWIIAFVNDADR